MPRLCDWEGARHMRLLKGAGSAPVFFLAGRIAHVCCRRKFVFRVVKFVFLLKKRRRKNSIYRKDESKRTREKETARSIERTKRYDCKYTHDLNLDMCSHACLVSLLLPPHSCHFPVFFIPITGPHCRRCRQGSFRCPVPRATIHAPWGFLTLPAFFVCWSFPVHLPMSHYRAPSSGPYRVAFDLYDAPHTADVRARDTRTSVGVYPVLYASSVVLCDSQK